MVVKLAVVAVVLYTGPPVQEVLLYENTQYLYSVLLDNPLEVQLPAEALLYSTYPILAGLEATVYEVPLTSAGCDPAAAVRITI